VEGNKARDGTREVAANSADGQTQRCGKKNVSVPNGATGLNLREPRVTRRDDHRLAQSPLTRWTTGSRIAPSLALAIVTLTRVLSR